MLRNFDREGYQRGGPKWRVADAYVRRAIKENLHRSPQGKMPNKWLRKITITDENSDQDKIKKIAGLMSLLAHQSSRSRIVRDVARAIIRAYNVEPKDFENELWALQHWIINNIRYTFDTGEQFQTPQRVLLDWYNHHDGADCDCLTMLYISLARALGHVKLAIGLLDSRGDGTISHAIALVKLPKPKEPWMWKWIPIELTKKVTFGWMTPKVTKLFAAPIKAGGGVR